MKNGLPFRLCIVQSVLALFLSVSCLSGGTEPGRNPDGPFAKGADVSWLPQMENAGYSFRMDSGEDASCLSILSSHGLDTVRLRVWVDPSGDPFSGHCSRDETVAMCCRARDAGFRIMIDFHYSDTWADPGQQKKPAAWSGLSAGDLADAGYRHTFDVLSALREAGVTPEWVQVGNEINDGLLWNEGRLSTSPANTARFINSGHDAVKAVFPGAQVIVHISSGNDTALFRWVFGQLAVHGAKYDCIGMSLYPDPSGWKKELDDAMDTARELSLRYGKPVMICETGMNAQAEEESFRFLSALIRVCREKDSHVEGVLYWEPECYNWAGYTKGAWKQDGRPSRALDAFR